jgi:hypothetical protein
MAANVYDDDRSDSKGVEPEGITIGIINKSEVNKKYWLLSAWKEQMPSLFIM